MSENLTGIPYPGRHPGGAALWSFALWQRQRQDKLPTRVMVCAKGAGRLILHDYGSQTPILWMAASKPKLRSFTVKALPVEEVAAYLLRTGWKLVSDSAVEARHAFP